MLKAPPTAPGLAWHEPLFPYQQEGVAALLSQPSLLLADDMGLGKTVQAIAALRLLRCAGPLRALVVVPAGLITQWRAAAAGWAPELTVSTVHGGGDGPPRGSGMHLAISSSSATRRFEQTLTACSPRPRRPWDVVVLDEAQKIKNADTDVSRACKRVRRKAQWALTGTPLENKIDDLASICDFLQPHSTGPSEGTNPPTSLLETHRSLQLRRRKDDVLSQLPPKSVFTIDLSSRVISGRHTSAPNLTE